MPTCRHSKLKTAGYGIIISFLMAMPVFAIWASTITEEDVKLWKMWINLAISGYTDPMPMNGKKERCWWEFWH